MLSGDQSEQPQGVGSGKVALSRDQSEQPQGVSSTKTTLSRDQSEQAGPGEQRWVRPGVVNMDKGEQITTELQ